MSTPAHPDAARILKSLTEAEPCRIGDLPRDHGIYALHDHEGVMRYIGITQRDRAGLWGRINRRHVAGSESRSHKFSHAYNTGRMYRAKKDTRPDAKLAKRLRTLFARRFCRASFVIMPPELVGNLGELELAVQALAPAAMLA